MAAAPLLLVVGGSNGAGKTTFAVPYAAQKGLPFLNADVLTKRFEDAGEKQPLIKAARLFLAQLYETLERGESVCIETTLSGGYIHGVVAKAAELGYRVELVYLFVDGPEVAIERIAGRVQRGGHHVPDEDVRRRFRRSVRNFVKLSEVVDMWECYSSNTFGTTLVAKRVDNETVVFLPESFSVIDRYS